MATRSTPIFIGARGNVIAVDRNTGETMWTTALKGGDFVDVMLVDGDLYAASKGRLYRVDPSSGDILWCNDLPGMGWGIVTIAGSQAGAAAAVKIRRQQAGNAATAASAS
jgi:outer membrane protein assembly factor BamB